MNICIYVCTCIYNYKFIYINYICIIYIKSKIYLKNIDVLIMLNISYILSRNFQKIAKF